MATLSHSFVPINRQSSHPTLISRRRKNAGKLAFSLGKMQASLLFRSA